MELKFSTHNGRHEKLEEPTFLAARRCGSAGLGRRLRSGFPRRRGRDRPESQSRRGGEGEGTLKRHFEIVQRNLEFAGNDRGLPSHLFPYLQRPLVQVLLRLAQVGYITDPPTCESRDEVLRLVLWWIPWVHDKAKASRIAFECIKPLEKGGFVRLGKEIYTKIIDGAAASRLQPPEKIETLRLHESPTEGTRPLRGWSRFSTPESDPGINRVVREFYRSWWLGQNGRHPILLWLQREYARSLGGEALAGMEEDTPFDFDHILPQAHWSWWTGFAKGQRLPDFFANDEERHYYVVGHAIGNVRIWSTSDNRSDGDASPKDKMTSHEGGPIYWMKKSAIAESQEHLWEACSPADNADGDNKKLWDLDRAIAFQRVVENRTFDLYKRLYDEVSFEQWIES
ncbi:MAG: DUF1524 domain-containing protein [Thiotrichales bacterium]